MIWNYVDALFYSLMVGAGEAFFAAYALELGFSELQAGLVTTVPIVIAGLTQVFVSYGINKFASYKNWTLTGVLLQSLIFLILIILRDEIQSSYLIFFLIITIYWTLNLAISPGWSSWISILIPLDKVRDFFSTRNIILAVGTLSGLVFSGLTLHYLGEEIFGIGKYNFIFILCFFFRFISLLSLTRLKRVSFVKIDGFFKNIINLKNNQTDDFIIKFILFSSFIKMGVYYSASFFSPYMLKQMNLSYLHYMLILVAAYTGRAFLGRMIKKYLKQFDINKIYFYAALGISFIPILWCLSLNFYYILILEFFTGILWGSFEIAFLVTCFESIPTEKQSNYMSLYNFTHTIFIGAGCLFGALTFYYLGNEQYSYHIIFFVSGVLRLISLSIFPGREIKLTTRLPFITKIYGVRPNMGGVGKVMLPFLKKLSKNKK